MESDVLRKKSSGESHERIPVQTGGVQVNFCKNPVCKNFGIPAKESLSKGKKDAYGLDTTGRSLRPALVCSGCGEKFPVKSNLGIAEETGRLARELHERPEPSCPNEPCVNHAVPVKAGSSAYHSFGKTHSGSHRYKCKACKRTFAVGTSTVRQRHPHKNKTVFLLLMNKSPFRRICEVARVNPKTLMRDKIEFIHQQCLAFGADRESALLDAMPIRRLYLSTDRQDYVVNWTHREDRRNVVLHAVSTADNATGYVFGTHLNYDATLDADAIEAEAEKIGDASKKGPYKRYARLWLKRDYMEALASRNGRKKVAGSLLRDVEASYAECAARDDVEEFETQDTSRRLPAKGMQVHAEYTLYAHFMFLRKLFSGDEKTRFCLDQDSGMRAACLSAFWREIKARRCDAFFVRIAKDKTVNEKRALVAKRRDEFELAKLGHPGLTDCELKTLLMKDRLGAAREIGRWRDRWIVHPLPDMSEPEKAVCYLTDYGDYDEDHLARLLCKASLHGTDRFLMQVRRRLSLLERPIATANNDRRLWHGYAAYNPAMVGKMLGIFRVFYNYCLAGEDKKTPAQRLGLTKARVELEDIIYFK